MTLMQNDMQTIIAQKLVSLYDMGIILSTIVLLLLINLLALLAVSIIIIKLITFISKVISYCSKPFIWLYKQFSN